MSGLVMRDGNAASTPIENPRIAFMAEQYDHVNSGPGTFTQYLRAAVEGGELDITFFSDDLSEEKRPYERRVELPVRLPSPPGHFVRQIMLHRAFVREQRSRPFDSLWYSTGHAGYVSSFRRNGVPLVLMVNDYSNALTARLATALRTVGPYRALTRRFWRRFELAAVRRADMVVVNSQFLRQELIRAYGLPESRVHVLYKAVDLLHFKPNAREWSTNAVRVLFVKNDYLLGGLRELLGALAGLSQSVALTVAGPPATAEGSVRRMVAETDYRGELTFAGRVGRGTMPGLMARHDIVCVPSRAEAFGVVFLEALACGVPVVGTRVGGIPEVLDGGRAGWLAPPLDMMALRACLESVLTQPEDRRRRTEHGLNHVRRFSREAMIERFRELTQHPSLQADGMGREWLQE
jgi:glycosyltransferase involved in cell wall biosynthesis